MTTSRAGLSVGDLSNIGQGDFDIEFQYASSQPAPLVGLLGQRGVCSHGDFWDIRVSDTQMVVETDDGTNYTLLESTTGSSPRHLLDGAVHSVQVQRSNGVLTLTIDSAFAGSMPSLSSFGPLAAAATGIYGCVGRDITSPLAGTLVSPTINGTGVFASDLSYIGNGDFDIKFDVSAVDSPDANAAATGTVALLGQRDICSHGNFWDIRLTLGHVEVETDDGVNYTRLQTDATVADGALHQIEAQRSSGVLTVFVDGTPSPSQPSLSWLESLAPVKLGTYGCVNRDGTLAVEGAITNP